MQNNNTPETLRASLRAQVLQVLRARQDAPLLAWLAPAGGCAELGIDLPTATEPREFLSLFSAPALPEFGRALERWPAGVALRLDYGPEQLSLAP